MQHMNQHSRSYDMPKVMSTSLAVALLACNICNISPASSYLDLDSQVERCVAQRTPNTKLDIEVNQLLHHICPTSFNSLKVLSITHQGIKKQSNNGLPRHAHTGFVCDERQPSGCLLDGSMDHH